MTNTIKKQFEKSYSTYNENAIVQKIMADYLVTEIVKISNYFPNILEIGSGTGILTSKLIKNIKYDNYFANDLVENSYEYIKKTPKINFFAGDILKIENEFTDIDLITSNAVFQWFKDIDTALNYISKWLKPNGVLAFSTFSPENFKEFKSITGISLEYHTIDHLQNIMNKYFYNTQIFNFEHVLNFNSPLDLLKHLKNTGVNSVLKKPWSLKEIHSFCHKNLKKLTYSPIIVISTNKK